MRSSERDRVMEYERMNESALSSRCLVQDATDICGKGKATNTVRSFCRVSEACASRWRWREGEWFLVTVDVYLFMEVVVREIYVMV